MLGGLRRSLASYYCPHLVVADVMGLPTPNLFAGEQTFLSRLEWVSVQDMEKAVDVIVEPATVWEDGGVRSSQ